MLIYAGYLTFILSVALAAGGVVLTTRLRNRYHHEIFSTLLYFQVFIFTFGFYGIWAQQLIKTYFSSYLSADLLQRISDVSILFGLPFLVFAWLMLIQFSAGLSGRKKSNWFVFWFLLLNFSIVIILGYFIARKSVLQPVLLMKYYFLSLHFVYVFFASAIILFPGTGKPLIHDFDSKRIGTGMFILMLLQCLPLFFYEQQPVIGLIFTFIFFSGNVFLPVYLTYGTLLTPLSAAQAKDLSLEDFCKKFEVSPRETDIVREICNGLSNKEISEKLFISLQTVKDHTHRIYTKTNVKSRVQLIYLVRDSITG